MPNKTHYYWRILLTLQGILLLLMAIQNSITSLGMLAAYVVALLLLSSPLLLILSAKQLFGKTKPIYKVAAAAGIIASLAGLVIVFTFVYIYLTYIGNLK